MSRLYRLAVLCVLTIVLSVSAPAEAEWFGDLYAGMALTGSRDVDVGSGGTLRNVNFDTSEAVGARVGYWFEDFEFLALALDILRYHPDISGQTVIQNGEPATVRLGNTDIRVISLGFDLMLRYPALKADEFPRGRLQPYFLLGPTLNMATANDTTNFGPPNNQSRSSARAGFNMGAGFVWQFQRHIGLFGEYRYTQFAPNFNFANSTEVQFNVNTHLLTGGISFRF